MAEPDPFKGLKRTQYCSEISAADIGNEITLFGWVHRRRDHGGVIFVDLRDREGIAQVVFNPQVSPEAHEIADTLRSEAVIGIRGQVAKRPEGMENPKMKTGAVEVMVETLTIFNRSQALPFNLDEDLEVDEAIRLRYRFLDLRRPALQRNFSLRHQVTKFTRDYFDELGFYEIETPFLTRSTPEGARDYLVPSRVQPGAFYALPQSPQLFKQILMIAGMDRYFQIARCFRDEDLRADRQPEFTQVDVEISFVRQEEIMEIMENWIDRLYLKVSGIELPRPFPMMTYEESMASYGVDNPDIRFDLKMENVTEIFHGSHFKVFQQIIEQGGVIKVMRLPGGAKLTRRELDNLTDLAKEWGSGGLIWAKCIEDGGLQCPVAKFFTEDNKKGLWAQTKAETGDLLLMMAGERKIVNPLMGRLRSELARQYALVDPNENAFVWIVDFPLFERDKEGCINAMHHPFTAPKTEDIPLLENDPEKCRSQAYDLVLNGVEIGGGSIRIHQPDIQKKIFSCLGISDEVAEEKFGFLIDALSYGAPPHGGIAFGLDRLVMLLAGAKSLREVIAFPKTQKATCLLTQSPSQVEAAQLRELCIRSTVKKDKARKEE